MYKAIRAHKTTRELYANQLAAEGVIADGDAKKMADDHRAKLDAGEVTTELAEVQPDDFTIDCRSTLRASCPTRSIPRSSGPRSPSSPRRSPPSPKGSRCLRA